jgi:hypothetical protein
MPTFRELPIHTKKLTSGLHIAPCHQMYSAAVARRAYCTKILQYFYICTRRNLEISVFLQNKHRYEYIRKLEHKYFHIGRQAVKIFGCIWKSKPPVHSLYWWYCTYCKMFLREMSSKCLKDVLNGKKILGKQIVYRQLRFITVYTYLELAINILC